MAGIGVAIATLPGEASDRDDCIMLAAAMSDSLSAIELSLGAAESTAGRLSALESQCAAFRAALPVTASVAREYEKEKLKSHERACTGATCDEHISNLRAVASRLGKSAHLTTENLERQRIDVKKLELALGELKAADAAFRRVVDDVRRGCMP